MSICAVENCIAEAKFRCSKCRTVHYCSIEHQKLDWPQHKGLCSNHIQKINQQHDSSNGLITTSSNNSQSCESKITNPDPNESRFCRCMFCGDELRLYSQEEAVDHMKVCPALQEQLQSSDQFTIPSIVKDKMKKN